jgi:hypothetical protein
LAEVELARTELTVEELHLLTYIQDASAYQTGRIDAEEYRHRLVNQTDHLPPGFNASVTISRLRVALFRETDTVGRAAILEEMRAAAKRQFRNPDFCVPVVCQLLQTRAIIYLTDHDFRVTFSTWKRQRRYNKQSSTSLIPTTATSL